MHIIFFESEIKCHPETRKLFPYMIKAEANIIRFIFIKLCLN